MHTSVTPTPHNCFLNKLMGTRIVPRDLAEITVIFLLEAPLECKVMNTFSMEPAFCAVKLPCREINMMGFRQAFWALCPLSLFSFYQLCTSTSGGCSPSSISFPSISPPACSIPFLRPVLVSIFSPHTFPLLLLSPLLLPSNPCLHMLCLGSFTWLEERKGEG